MAGGAGQILLDLGHAHEEALVHDAAQLRHERHVLGHVARLLAELRVVLHEPGHVLWRETERGSGVWGFRVEVVLQVRLNLREAGHILQTGDRWVLGVWKEFRVS